MSKFIIILEAIFASNVLGGRILFCSPPELLSHRLSIHPVAKSLQDRGHDVLSFALSVQEPSLKGPVPGDFPVVEDVDKFFWEIHIWGNVSLWGLEDFVWNMYYSPFWQGKS